MIIANYCNQAAHLTAFALDRNGVLYRDISTSGVEHECRQKRIGDPSSDSQN